MSADIALQDLTPDFAGPDIALQDLTTCLLILHCKT
jgi:hypothetical protein